MYVLTEQRRHHYVAKSKLRADPGVVEKSRRRRGGGLSSRCVGGSPRGILVGYSGLLLGLTVLGEVWNGGAVEFMLELGDEITSALTGATPPYPCPRRMCSLP